MKIQYENTDTMRWLNVQNENYADELIGGAMAFNSLTREQVVAALESGESLKYRWDCSIRSAAQTAPVAAVVQAVEYVRCDCGHSVARIAVMSASRGTACPDCYDRLSA